MPTTTYLHEPKTVEHAVIAESSATAPFVQLKLEDGADNAVIALRLSDALLFDVIQACRYARIELQASHLAWLEANGNIGGQAQVAAHVALTCEQARVAEQDSDEGAALRAHLASLAF